MIDIQDFIFVDSDSNDLPRGNKPFDPIKTVRCWNQYRMDQYETDWGQPTRAKRVEKARQRLVIQVPSASQSNVSATAAEGVR